MRCLGNSFRVSGLVLAGLLAACGTDPTLGPWDKPPQTAVQPAPANQTQAPAANRAASAPAVETAKPVEPPPPTVAKLPPLQLLGMSRADIVRNLGEPAFQRRDRTALLLRYRQDGCILDLFMYPRGPVGSDRAVDYVEARTPTGRKLDTQPCVEAVRKSNRAG